MLLTVVLCIIFCLLIAWLIVRDRLRTTARTQADQILAGSISTNAEHITKIILRLLPAFTPSARTKADQLRVRQLRILRSEMLHPHG